MKDLRRQYESHATLTSAISLDMAIMTSVMLAASLHRRLRPRQFVKTVAQQVDDDLDHPQARAVIPSCDPATSRPAAWLSGYPDRPDLERRSQIVENNPMQSSWPSAIAGRGVDRIDPGLRTVERAARVLAQHKASSAAVIAASARLATLAML
ncbi:MAG TPA: hypothetical protein VMM15_23970 [Bradyrhizobium sp.]|nr:hypothetical protein [Bradyrhizobium sp.]